MLSYRHAFHAGNAADAVKHAALCFTLAYLTQKPKPLYLIDTHAGAGHYDLADAMALKTGEAQSGIVRLLDRDDTAPAFCADYLSAVRAARGAGSGYPGSPALMRRGMRPGDRLDLVELHPTDHATLAGVFARDRAVRTVKADGLETLIARMPPKERRGLAVIDPSYEVKSDYETIPPRLGQAVRRFATGVYVLWYPVIDRARTEQLVDSVSDHVGGRMIRLELCLEPDRAGRGMTGSGLVIVNPPYVLADAAREGLAWMGEALGAAGGWRVEDLGAAE